MLKFCCLARCKLKLGVLPHSKVIRVFLCKLVKQQIHRVLISDVESLKMEHTVIFSLPI